MAVKTTTRTWENISITEGRFNAVASLDNGVGTIELFVGSQEAGVSLDPKDVWDLADLFISLKTELKKRNITPPLAVGVSSDE